MSNSTTSIQVRNSGRGRKTSDKTARVRRSVLSALVKSEGTLSTKDIARMTKQSKYNVVVALRWLEAQGVVVKNGTVKHEGRGRPMAAWVLV